MNDKKGAAAGRSFCCSKAYICQERNGDDEF